MEKATAKWFKEHGWKEEKFVFTEESGDIRRTIRYSIPSPNGEILVYWERVVWTYERKRGFRRPMSSRLYSFYARNAKTRFEVLNRVSHHNFPVDTIVAALKVVGYNEWGEYLDRK